MSGSDARSDKENSKVKLNSKSTKLSKNDKLKNDKLKNDNLEDSTKSRGFSPTKKVDESEGSSFLENMVYGDRLRKGENLDFDSLDSSKNSYNFNKLIGERMRTIRLSLGFTQHSLSKLMGITFQQLQKYEKGLNRVSAATLWSLAGKIGINVSSFFPTFLTNSSESGARVREKKTLFDLDFSSNDKNKNVKDIILLVRDFNDIKSNAVRKKVLSLVSSIASTQRLIDEE